MRETERERERDGRDAADWLCLPPPPYRTMCLCVCVYTGSLALSTPKKKPPDCGLPLRPDVVLATTVSDCFGCRDSKKKKL